MEIRKLAWLREKKPDTVCARLVLYVVKRALRHKAKHICRNGCGHTQGAARERMNELDVQTVQRWAGDEIIFLHAVEKVTGQWAANGGHMQPQLVRSAGVRGEVHKAETRVLRQHTVASKGRLAVCIYAALYYR